MTYGKLIHIYTKDSNCSKIVSAPFIVKNAVNFYSIQQTKYDLSEATQAAPRRLTIYKSFSKRSSTRASRDLNKSCNRWYCRIFVNKVKKCISCTFTA